MNCKTCSGPCCLKGSNHEGDCEGYKPMSHYERIKAMSIEEMTRWLAKICDCLHCPGFYGTCYARCEEYWLDWLRQEVKE